MTLKSQVHNKLKDLKTGKRIKAGRPKGKYNYICVCCGKYFHVAPAHMGKIRRCHRCRGTETRGRPADYEIRHTCPLCEGWKHQKSNICAKCWESGRRWDAIRKQEK